MKKALFNLAAVFTLLASPAEVTRDTDWYLVPDTEKVGNVVDLAAPKTNEIEAISFGMIRPTSRVLPKYLHELKYGSTFKEDAEWYYEQADYKSGHCSSRRIGGFLERNYDWLYDESAEFVVRMARGDGRFASVGIANVGTNLTESFVLSRKWSRYYKCLPGHMLDGINENGVAVNINVTSGESGWRTSGEIHCLGAVRWVLDHGVTAKQAAEYLAANVYIPDGFGMNFHYMIADKSETWIVENGIAYKKLGVAVMTNYRLYPYNDGGSGQERYAILDNVTNRITDAWWTKAYERSTTPVRASDIGTDATVQNQIFTLWESKRREEHRSETFGGEGWWQTCHTVVYDIANLSFSVCVQENPVWHTFALVSPFVDEDRARKIEAVKRDKNDLKVYRKAKDIWTWTNWNAPGATKEAPADFLAFANSPCSEPLYFDKGLGGWFYALQFWPNGNVKYIPPTDPSGDNLENSTTVNFAFIAYAEDGKTELFRFGASAHRDTTNDETLVCWDEKNQFVRLATTDIIPELSPVKSVNEKTGVVLLNAEDVGALKKPLVAKHLNFAQFDRNGEIIDSGKDASSFVQWTEDRSGNKTAISIGDKRTDRTKVGPNSLTVGLDASASGYDAMAVGSVVEANGMDSVVIGQNSKTTEDAECAIAAGVLALASNMCAFVWNGDGLDEYYGDHGYGTLNVNPKGGLAGLWVGETSMSNHIAAISGNAVRAEEARATAVEDRIIEEIDAFKSFDIRVMDSLPASGEVGVVYLVKAADYATTKTRDEYLWSQGAWRLIGSTRFDSDKIAKTISTTPIPDSLTNRVSYINNKEYGGVVVPENEDGSVVIGDGAVGTISPDYIASLASKTGNFSLRSVSVAIGKNAQATGGKDSGTAQAIAIGFNAKSTGSNSIAIGDGAVHWYETDETGNGTVASASESIAFGYDAKAKASGAMQIGRGKNETANSLKFRDTFIVKDGKVQGGVDTNAVKNIVGDELDPVVHQGQDEEITVKSHAITTISPTNAPVDELYLNPTGTRNFEVYLPNTDELRSSLPILFDTEIEGTVTKLGPWWTKKITKLPAKLTMKEPIDKTLILEVEEYATDFDWTPVVTKAVNTNGSIRITGEKLHFTEKVSLGSVVLPVRNPLYGNVNVNTNGFIGVSGKLLDGVGNELATFIVE